MKYQHIFKNLSILFFGMAFSCCVQAATVALANSPLIKLTTGEVKPNILFVLDDSGSMVWTYMPDAVDNFRGSYGYMSSHCNGVYYDPNVTYDPPISSTSAPKLTTPVRMANASFTAARDNGFDSASATTNLNTGFIANRFVPESGNTDWAAFGSYTGTTSIGPFGAVYYQYTGSVTDKDYINTGSTFYTQCDTAIGNTTSGRNITLGTSSSVFTRVRLATATTTTITVTGTGSSGGSNGTLAGITVNGVQIMNSASAPASSITANTMAANIAARITLNGFSATASANVITITGPTSAAGYYPIPGAVTGGGTIAFTSDVFPYTDAAKLTNFANWYSYYRTRMLTMKTSAAQAFYELDENYRVGLMNINASAPSVALGTYSGTNRTNWYDTLYSVGYSLSGTPLRRALSNAGRYYANKLSGTTDPVQYSCQQNFTILSTDGYWNGNAGLQLDGASAIGNQDGGTTDRPMYDGSPSYTNTYTRNNYSISTSGCTSGRRRLVTQVQSATCQVVNSGDSCTPTSSWANSGSPTNGSCRTTVTLPTPNPSDPTLASTVANAAGGASDTLADVAMYYYKTDLRNSALSNCTGGAKDSGTSGDVCEDNVFKSGRDTNEAQHMTTFTLGLGADGLMGFKPNYETDVGDYSAVRDGSTASASVCTWQTAGTTCNWPAPSANDPTAIDDMWHAAVNGRGTYFNANNPDTLATGLKGAIVGIQQRRGAAAAAASSTLSPVDGNNASFFPTYTTNVWTGNLESRSININTGLVSRTATWCVESIPASSCNTPLVPQTSGSSTIYNCETPVTASCTDKGGVIGYSGNLTSGPQYCKTQMAEACTGTFTTPRQNGSVTSSMVLDSSDTRTIKTSTLVSGKNVLTNFDASFVAANSSYFDASRLASLSQWTTLTAAQKTAATANILGYLRGQYGYDTDDNNVVYTAGVMTTDNRIFRKREAVLGDILESKPTYNGKSLFSYGYPGYDAFKTAQNSNSTVIDGTVYVGANDGMLHAFAANTGVERWAYIPSMVVPNLWKLADINYSADEEHRNYVNGSPAVSDVCVQNCNSATSAVWKTILVGGLGQGGRGYYALDITNPASPSLLWEFTTTAGIGSTQDDDVGFTYGKPVIARKPDNTWTVIVTSGYNNESPGNGKGYLYVLNAGTGAIISKISTGEGTSTTPSGLAKIAAWNQGGIGNEVGDIYGGDLLGNVWKFNINDTSTSAEIGTGSVTKFAKLYSETAGTNVQPITTTPVLGQSGSSRIVFVTTGKFLEKPDSSTTLKQSVYAIKDDGLGGTLNNPRNTLVQQTITVSSGNTDTRTVTSPQPVNFASGKGWYADLPDSGERVNVDAQLTQGVLVVPSLVPATTACTPNGYGWLNYFGYDTGAPVAGLVSEKSNAPIVGVNIVYTSQGGKIIVTDANGGTTNMGPPLTGSAGNFSGKRTLWRELTQ